MAKKRPEYKVQLVLATLLLLGSSLAYWFEYSKKPAQEALEAESKKPIDLKNTQIATITLLNEERKILLACLDLDKDLCKPGDNSHWEIREPVKFKADDSVVGSLVSNLNNLKPATVIDLSTDTPEKRAQLLVGYRLDKTAQLRKNAKSVIVTGKDGSTTAIHFGDKHPIEEGLFSLIEKNGVPSDLKVFVIANHQITPLDQPASSFRNKQILSLTQTDVTEMTVSGGKRSSPPVFVKKEGVNWNVSLKNTPPVPGDNDSIDSVISGAIFLNAKGFSDDSKTSSQARKILASSKKRLEIKLKTHAGAEQILTLFEKKFTDGKNEASQAYATVSGLDPLYQIETTVFDRLDKGYADFRLSRLIPTMSRIELKWIEVEGKGFSQTIEKGDAGWMISKGKLGTSRLESFLDRMTSDAISSTLPQTTQAVEPKVRVAFGPAKANRKFEFTFFRKDGRTFAIDELSSHKESYVLRDELTGLIPWDEKAWLQAANTDKPKADGHH